MNYDVFNGDADGICALHQLRLAEEREAELVTGVKRDIRLLSRVRAGAGDALTVLDISFDANREDALRLLDAGARVQWFDHHYAGELPEADGLEAHINTAAGVCTSLLVSRCLDDAYLPWAVAAAFGDNLHEAARAAAAPLGLDGAALSRLEQLGTLLNYNGYGVSLDDLFFHPAELYRQVHAFEDAFAFIEQSGAMRVLAEGFEADMARAREAPLALDAPGCAAVTLPDAPWARRVSGVYANELARAHPERAHALAMKLPDGAWRISVRAPRANPEGADELCRRFPTGGGRAAAAGINALPADQFEIFLKTFQEQYVEAQR